MQLHVHSILWLIAIGAVSFKLCDEADPPTECIKDDCYQAICNTSQNPQHTITALVDCLNYIYTTVTCPKEAIPATGTVPAVPTTGSIEQYCPVPIPLYATACSGSVRYSSICSCLGVKSPEPVWPFNEQSPGANRTQSPTKTKTSTTAAPTSTPDFNSDPLNCGSSGTICPPNESCLSGVCSEDSCSAYQSCETGFTTNCNGNSACYCFKGISGKAVCASDLDCSEVSLCGRDSDCGSGTICVVDTCCTSLGNYTGVCLFTNCPQSDTMDAAKQRKRGTAAFR
ncbi:uncharacterized protein BP5553_04674 [Venustampulla echinocandica]|uniref:EGF-like domain-containing protein n=1 Tax=Venustampulla echinocandica TaxID=2656787 RepID=A0A370TP01_9HELO|nr:uncharacterized protein BP5553_04674 [Venustampulla echinocandica]RDL37241.1 hypothetical protein BP5553_04674 [Venustampulla echinocandica]